MKSLSKSKDFAGMYADMDNIKTDVNSSFKDSTGFVVTTARVADNETKFHPYSKTSKRQDFHA